MGLINKLPFASVFNNKFIKLKSSNNLRSNEIRKEEIKNKKEWNVFKKKKNDPYEMKSINFKNKNILANK